MSISKVGGSLIGLGILFLVLSIIIGWFSILSLIFIIVGIIVLVAGKVKKTLKLSALEVVKTVSFNRHDIITATNWKRIGFMDRETRKIIGIILTVAGTVLLIVGIAVEVAWWLIIPALPLLGIGIYFLFPKLSIEYDYTKKLLIKIPDILSMHTLHVTIRHCIEDMGYIISEDVSPGEGSQSEFDNKMFLLKGGVKAYKEIRRFPTGRGKARMYILEEGTGYIETINVYNTKTSATRDPAVSIPHTSCELLITVGATRDRKYDPGELRKNFNAVVGSIENTIKENITALKINESTSFVREIPARTSEMHIEKLPALPGIVEAQPPETDMPVNVKCQKCGGTFQVTSTIRPLEVVCPHCGVKGTLK